MSTHRTPALHVWNDFVKSQPLGSLYQTSIWAHFQSTIPGKEKTLFITIPDQNQQAFLGGGSPDLSLGGGLIIIRSLPLGMAWIECPRGPVFRDDLSPEQLEYFFKAFFEQIQSLTREYKIVHLRIDPPIEKNSHLAASYESTINHLNLRPAHASYTPETTLIVDLAQTEEDILKQMKSKGRYNINVAKKHNITIEHVTRDSIGEFYTLIAQTGARDGFATNNLAYYESMLETLGDSAALWIAYVPATPNASRKPIAALIATYFTDTATYYYGASSYEDRHLMAPYLLQWEVMRDAKEKGYTKYDMLGIATPERSVGALPVSDPFLYSYSKSHPLAGVTDFKMKFGGRIITYIPAKELIYRPIWHGLIRLRKWMRG